MSGDEELKTPEEKEAWLRAHGVEKETPEDRRQKVSKSCFPLRRLGKGCLHLALLPGCLIPLSLMNTMLALMFIVRTRFASLGRQLTLPRRCLRTVQRGE